MSMRLPDDLDTERLNREGRRGAVLLAKQERYARRVAAGLCGRSASHGPVEPGHTMCIGCLVDQRHDQNDRNAQRSPRRRVLTCKVCGRAGHNARGCAQPRPADFNPVRVAGERRSKYRRALAAQGRCINGAKHALPEHGFRQCAECRARGKAKS